jgi:hypothetical protein
VSTNWRRVRSASAGESAYLLRRLHLLALDDQEAAALAEEVVTWPAIPPRRTWAHVVPPDDPDPVMTWQVQLGEQDFSMYTVMSSFGTPADITLSELTIELFFPADQATEDLLRDRTR